MKAARPPKDRAHDSSYRKLLKNADESTVTESRSVVTRRWGEKRKKRKGGREGYKSHQETFGGDAEVHCLDGHNGVTGV